jgi:DNA-binding MarR family transcriptional regulator
MSRGGAAIDHDPETRLDASDHESLRVWLRMFTCTKLIERRIDALLKRDFGSSLPRFDLLAQLHRSPDGLRMGELSARTLTTGGNVTWLVSSLVREGLVSRRVAPNDRRAAVVRLTAAGRRAFEAMASAHEQHVERLFDGVVRTDRRLLHRLLGSLKQQLPTDVSGTEP